MPLDDEPIADPLPTKEKESQIQTGPLGRTIPGSAPNQNDIGEPGGRPGFEPGAVLAARYCVIRFIAMGGMGEVYEVEDQTLRGRLALKTIRPDVASSPASAERFKREINIARRITHPNVSRIYDLGVHHGKSDTMFLTMEFLAGDNLHDQINRDGRMSENDALPLAEQIAAGLAAAHDVGIIHRDFKSANVMLVPGSAGRGVRAVVTDFGLARLASSEEGMATMSEAGAIMGTPAYMAPEQVQGSRLTPAADIYAFGIVLYEMMTAKRPFEGSTPLSTAVKRLTDAPRPPRQVVPTLDPTWNSVILRCLERDPAARFASALDVTSTLRSGITPPTEDQRTNRDTPTVAIAGGAKDAALSRRKVVREGVILGTLLSAAAIAFVGFRFWPPSQSAEVMSTMASTHSPSVPSRRAAAVLGLRNNSGQPEAAWLSTAISEMLAAELAAGGKLRVAPGQEVARVTSDLGLGDTDSITAENLQRVRKSLNIQSLVLGSYTLVGDQRPRLLRIRIDLLDATTGKVIHSSSTSGTEAQLSDLVSRAGGGLRQTLHLGDLTPAEAVQVEASFPSDREAVRLYTEGLSKLRSLDAAGARDLLTRAATADKKSPLTHSALSAAYSALGYDSKARGEAGQAVALSGSLGREQKLEIEARSHEAAKEWDKAVEAERSLWESFPDSIEYGLDLASSQISAGKTKEALVTTETLRKLPLPASADGRIDLVESRAYQELGDFVRQKKLAASAATKGRSTGARLLVAKARMLEATALLALGDMQGTTAAADEARSLYQSAGDRGGVARALEHTARSVHRTGDLEGERQLLERSLAIHREIGDRGRVAGVLLNIGTVLVKEGRSSQAAKYFDESLATFREIGATYDAAAALNDIGMMMFNRGDLPAAQKRYQEALTLFSGLREKSGTATTLTNIAEVLECRGQLEEARKMHQDSLAINREIGDKGGIAYDTFRLGEIFALRGDLAAARDHYQEALSIQTQIGDKLGAADTRVGVANLAIEEGRPAEAEKAAREGEEILRTQGAAERSVLGLAAISESLLAQGKQKAAFDIADRAWKVAAKSEDRRIRFTVAVSLARARAASKKPEDVDAALESLQATAKEASGSLFVVSELEARLASGEIEVAAGRAVGKKHLAALEKDAQAKGFTAIARRAAIVGA